MRKGLNDYYQPSEYISPDAIDTANRGGGVVHLPVLYQEEFIGRAGAVGLRAYQGC